MTSIQGIYEMLVEFQKQNEIPAYNINIESLNLVDHNVSLQNIIDLLQLFIEANAKSHTDLHINSMGVDMNDVDKNIDMSKPVIIKRKKKCAIKKSDIDSDKIHTIIDNETKKNTEPEVNVSNQKDRKPLFILPFTGVVNESKCFAIRMNHKLHTQCVNDKLKSGGKYCRTCQKNADKNNGIPPFGDIHSRMNIPILDYIDPKGNKTVPYYKIIKKIKFNNVQVTREQVEQEANLFGLNIPDVHWGPILKETTSKKISPQNDVKVETADDKPNKSGRPIKPIVYVNECDIIKSEVEDTEISCEQFEFENQTYLKTDNNELYDINTEDYVGIFDEKTKTIIS